MGRLSEWASELTHLFIPYRNELQPNRFTSTCVGYLQGRIGLPPVAAWLGEKHEGRRPGTHQSGTGLDSYRFGACAYTFWVTL